MASDKFIIKVCGMRDSENVKHVASLAPTLMGFIFYPKSSRYAGEIDPAIVADLPTGVTPVGVWVNETNDSIISTAKRFNIHTVQLHGSETPQQCRELRAVGYTVIKAAAVKSHDELMALDRYRDCVDYLLFDTAGQHVNGGTGRKWDWHIIADYPLTIPFLLSGGIGPDDVEEILQASQPLMAGVDVNSRFEIQPGLKNVAQLSQFINSLRKNFSK